MKKYAEWIIIVLGGIASVGGCIHSVNRKYATESNSSVGYYNNVESTGIMEKAKVVILPQTWTSYRIADTFILSVPNTMELKDVNLYTRTIEWNGQIPQKEIMYFNNDSIKQDLSEIVFQQKGLLAKEKEAFDAYCRIMIRLNQGKAGDYLKCDEYKELTMEDTCVFQKIAKQSAGEFKVMGSPQVRWLKLGNIYGIEVEYVREGLKKYGTSVFSYYFFYDDKKVNIVLSYRKQDSQKWKDDFSNVIKTFEWIN